MRADQRVRLAKLAEKLAEVVLRDADPDNWVAGNKAPADMTQQERGDAYWCRKIAAASHALLNRTVALVDRLNNPGRESDADLLGGEPPANDHDVDHEIARYEKEAARMVEAVIKRAGVK